ncbi:Uncharacterized ACR, COG1993 [Legionella steigerwaltii]|uniref:Uncharacterized ACR, COG1993 n=1 Tax=Legionella steigerwaltii TaxID=460 RepID=A0A378LA79_9GAMM|nr:DUF190 domain-containing protein [Legionella steigerwaltii]KTD75743.1 hypothetical protein Lstg_2422 [Legionella steigerwaltii]STY23746.1 Uncharacterized ACR, COG1993 [Legionella steigerwaltii]
MSYEKVSVYINEAEQWQDKPLYLELLEMLREQKVAGATVLRGVAGFPLDTITKTSLFHIKKLPLIVQFIDDVEVIEVLILKLKNMLPQHLIARVPVDVVC